LAWFLFLIFIVVVILVPLFVLCQLIDSARLTKNSRQAVFLVVIMTWMLPGAVYNFFRLLRIAKRNHVPPADVVSTPQSVGCEKVVDFKSKLNLYRGIVIRSFLFLCSLLLFALALIAFITKRVTETGLDFTSVVFLVVFVPTIAVLMVCTLLKPEKCLPQLGLVCPVCGKPLVGLASQAIITTGRCGSCGSQVL
jgi:hypothetical protein